jgi:hypothetical protein
MTRKDADDLRALADLFRQRRRSVVIIADDDDQDPVGVHHGHSRRPRVRCCLLLPYRKKVVLNPVPPKTKAATRG